MKAKKGLKPYLVYLLVRVILSLLQVFPVERNLRSARWLARMWVRLMPRHRERALKHLRESFPGEYSEQELADLADRCLEHWTMFAFEEVYTARLINRFTWHRYINLVNFNEALQLLLENRGVVMVTGHYGHFELVGHFLACIGFKMAAVMRPLDNAYLNEYLVRTRRTHGLELLDKKGAMYSSRGILQAGAQLAFIADQDAGPKGLFVDFFGRPASTYKSIGLLAMGMHCPIIVGYARRRGARFAYDVGVERIIYPSEWEQQADPLRWITQTYTAAIEAFVRAAPAQYLWIHRRWKNKPKSAGAAADAGSSLSAHGGARGQTGVPGSG